MKHLKLTLLLTMFMSMVVSNSFSHDIEVQNIDGKTIYYVWKNSNTELAVSYKGSSYTNSNSYSGDIVIPESVLYQGNSYRVTSVDQHAFEDCSELASVTIPNSVTWIRYEAFRKCTGLTSIIIPQNVTRIDQNAFYGCSNLVSVSVLNSETSIGIHAFEYTAWEENQPNGVIYIGKVLYKYKGYIPENTSVTIKAGTVEISDNAFWSSYVNGLSSITIPNSVRKIGSRAFYNCKSLASIDIPSSVTSIGAEAFQYSAWYNNLPDGLVYAGKVAYKYKGIMPDNTNIIIQEGTTEIAGSAFEDCTGLNSIVLPNSITKIGTYSFGGCNHLQSIVIPEGVTEIGWDAFDNCTNLMSVSIPSSMIKIEGLAFYGCSMLNKVIISDISSWCNINFGNGGTSSPFDNKHQLYFSNGNKITDLIVPNGVKSIGDYVFYGCNGLTSITIPNSVTYIGVNAFWGCTGLTSIMIPQNVTSIGNFAFSGCSNLTNVTVMNGTPVAIKSYTFSNRTNATLYVPYGSKTAYMTADYWKEFKEIVEMPIELTDISEMDNIIYAEGLQAYVGAQKGLTFKMKNTKPIRGFQFDLTLPAGVTPATYANGTIKCTLVNGRLAEGDQHTISVSQQADGSYRVLCGSLGNDVFTGNDGEVLTLTVNVADDMTAGSYPIVLKNIKLTETDISNYYETDKVVVSLAVDDYRQGDFSGDGKTDVSDYIGVANYIMGDRSGNQNAKAADVDGNSKVDVSDYIGIANIILTGSVNGNQNATARNNRQENSDGLDPQ